MKFFSRLYLSFMQWAATLMLRWTGAMVRRVLVLQGKDPDFVPPPPPPPPSPPVHRDVNIDESKAAWMVDTRNRPTRFGMPDSAYVNHPEKHPILVGRKAYEDKLAKAEADKKAKEHRTEIADGSAIEALREAVAGVENLVITHNETKRDE